MTMRLLVIMGLLGSSKTALTIQLAHTTTARGRAQRRRMAILTSSEYLSNPTYQSDPDQQNRPRFLRKIDVARRSLLSGNPAANWPLSEEGR
jgi:hypothetical protein